MTLSFEFSFLSKVGTSLLKTPLCFQKSTDLSIQKKIGRPAVTASKQKRTTEAKRRSQCQGIEDRNYFEALIGVGACRCRWDLSWLGVKCLVLRLCLVSRSRCDMVTRKYVVNDVCIYIYLF